MKQVLGVLMTLGTLVLVGCTLLSPTATPTPTPIPISHVYAFGDSYSDNGNMQKLMPSGPPWDLLWEGRASNGPTAVEVLATRLNVELTNYAVGGAKSDRSNVNPLSNTGALGQIDKFKTALAGQPADPAALYFIMIGGNDYLQWALTGATPKNATLTDQTVDNIATGLTQLAELGAKRFLVVNSVDLTALPFIVATNQTESASEFQTLLNSKLAARVEELKSQLNLDLTLFDYTALSIEIRKSPADYGLTNTTEACQPWFMGVVKPACATPDEYYFWDEVHPTRRTHQIFGEAWAALFGK